MKHNLGRWIVVACLVSFGLAVSRRVEAQASGMCRTDRVVSTLVGAGLGAAAGAIPATIVHRHDQTSSHRIVIGSIAAGTLIGFVAAGRDRPCISRADAPPLAGGGVAGRAAHARHGVLVGSLTGAVVGAAGGTLYGIGCAEGPCNENATRAKFMLFSAGEGAVAGGLLGSLIGWAWPIKR